LAHLHSDSSASFAWWISLIVDSREDREGTERIVTTFADVLRVLDSMKRDGIVDDCAIGGAMAVSFWAEPVATQDLDVVITLRQEMNTLDPLRALFDWLRRAGIAVEGEHAVIAGVPVQFLVAWSPLVEEAVRHAAERPYDASDAASPLLRLIEPTYLVAMWTFDRSADTARRRERTAMLREAGLVDEGLLETLRERFS
jgi:hypothetical protein